MTGFSRFTEDAFPVWSFNKDENFDVKQFDVLVSTDSQSPPDFTLLGHIDAFSGFTWYPFDEILADAKLLKLRLPFHMNITPTLFIHKCMVKARDALTSVQTTSCEPLIEPVPTKTIPNIEPIPIQTTIISTQAIIESLDRATENIVDKTDIHHGIQSKSPIIVNSVASKDSVSTVAISETISGTLPNQETTTTIDAPVTTTNSTETSEPTTIPAELTSSVVSAIPEAIPETLPLVDESQDENESEDEAIYMNEEL
jgi:hypothetical protein